METYRLGMTFTANQSGGDYKHQHQYGLLYGEYFGLHSRELKLFTNDLNNNGSWQVSSPAGYQSQDAFNNGNTSVINSQSNQYQNYAKTETKRNLAPYFVVSRWRRTA